MIKSITITFEAEHENIVFNSSCILDLVKELSFGIKGIKKITIEEHDR